MAGSGTAHLRPADDTILRVEDLVVTFRGRGRNVQAVSGISIDVVPGETLGVVGESGCGKSTTAGAIVQMPRPTSGRVIFEHNDLVDAGGAELRALRAQLQVIYQDPISSLNPRRTVGQIIEEPLRIWNRGTAEDRRANVAALLDAVGIDPDAARRRPHEFSGGQCQRICIARALALQPKMLICDEPVSALDVSVQAQILNLLEDMKDLHGLTMLFISHDLGVVRNVSDRVVVMYLGKICEVGSPELLFDEPAHPYTAALLSAVPRPESKRDRSVLRLAGELPSPMSPPSGCRFRTRCPRAQPICGTEEPTMSPVGTDRDQFVACHFPLRDGGRAGGRPVGSEPWQRGESE